MPSTAAWSASSLSPLPTSGAHASAAASVTRTSSRARLRSGREECESPFTAPGNLQQRRGHYDRGVSAHDLTIEARIPPAIGPVIGELLGAARGQEVADRLRDEDPTLWGPPGTPEIANRLGWLRIAERVLDEL